MTAQTNAQARNQVWKPHGASMPLIGSSARVYRQLEPVVQGGLSAENRTDYRV